jgi:hypothetical protein
VEGRNHGEAIEGSEGKTDRAENEKIEDDT